MKALAFVASILSVYCYIGSAIAASMGIVVGGFALACMNNIETPAGLSVLNKDAAKLRPEHADPFLRPDRGVAYLHKFDNDGQMIVGIKESGGCKIISKEALRQDVEGMILEGFRRGSIPNRVLAIQKDDQHHLVQTTFAVSYHGKHLFLVLFGPDNAAQAGGVSVEVSPASHPPQGVNPQGNIPWPG
jgi:hypothetical protein